MIAARSSSASLPRSPESDIQAMIQAAGGSSGSGQGSLGSHGSTQEVYVNIYQNTNHPSLFVSGFGLFFLLTLTFNTVRDDAQMMSEIFVISCENSSA